MKRDLVVIGHPLASSSKEELHLLNYLMRNRNILWVNDGQEQRDIIALPRVVPGSSPVANNSLICEYTPHHVTRSTNPWLQGLDHHLLTWQVQRMIHSRKIQDPILWVNSVQGGELATQLTSHRVIYFCNENMPKWPHSAQESWLQRQAALVAKADLILATDPAQAARFPVHKTCLLNTPSPLLSTTTTRPKDLPRGRPIAGFYGTLETG